MKKLIILILLAFSYQGFCQSMHLSPDTRLPIATDSLKNVNNHRISNSVFDEKNSHVNTLSTDGAPLTYTTKYNATVLNTNFTLPLLRVNFLVNKPVNSTNSLAGTSFFNSAGAGINVSTGELDVITDGSGNTVSIDYHNHFGLQAGFLFASNSTNATDKTGATTQQSGNIFAIAAAVSVLNFQFGGGYELGALTQGQRRGFLTVAYAIPMSVLIDGGYKILHMSAIK